MLHLVRTFSIYAWLKGCLHSRSWWKYLPCNSNPTSFAFNRLFVKHLTIVYCNAVQSVVVYVITSNFVVYVTLRTKNRIAFCVNTSYGVRIVIVKLKRFKILEKFYSSKTLLKLAGGGMHPPHPSLDPPLCENAACPKLLRQVFVDILH